ncbi:MAG: PQQ-dependent sugar dehydrogenase [Acidimicrobiaceae bacterium]|nr:PQQ-dependent sugar dehydrogenase [Acidimicrobiaceae bacterium]
MTRWLRRCRGVVTSLLSTMLVAALLAAGSAPAAGAQPTTPVLAGLSADDDTAKRVTLSWTEPDACASASPACIYQVRYKKKSATEPDPWNWTTVATTSSTASGVTTVSTAVTGLGSGVEYDLEVRALQGTSGSEEVKAQGSVSATTLDVPLAPELTATRSADRTGIILRWTRSTDSTDRAAPTAWRFQTSSDGVNWTGVFDAVPTGRALDLDTDPDADLCYRVRATSAAGPSEWSNIAPSLPPAGQARGAPDAPTVSRGDGGELVAEWQPPANECGPDVTGWQLRHSKDGNDWTDVSGTVTGKRWTTIAGLANGDEYQVQVRAVTARDAGAWSPSGRGTPAAAPVIRIEEVATGLSIPWGLAFTPDGTMIFTERGGRINVRFTDGTVHTVQADFADLGAEWETGLMALLLDPDFGANRNFYTCQGHTDPADLGTADRSVQVIKWSMSADYTAATRVEDPLVGGVDIHINTQWQHAGCRLRFGPQGHLWITTGDGLSHSISPQDLTNLNGKVLRVHKDTGEGVPGNPFYYYANADTRRIYTYGHRNPQGLARRPGTDQMWSVEHGTDRDDEINLLVAGGNYGYAPQGHAVCGYRDPYPVNQYCIDAPMTDLKRFPNAVPARWSSGYPTLATSGGIFLEGEHWGAWEGRMAVGGLRTRSLWLFNFTPEGEFVSKYREPKAEAIASRLRTPMMGPDGALYVTTSDNRSDETYQGNEDGIDEILRVYVYDAAADATLSALTLTGSDGSAVALSPAFTTGVLRYRAEVAHSVTGVTVTPVKSRPGATATVNGRDPSAAVPLDRGHNFVTVVVAAEDGRTTRTYTVDVIRAAPPPPSIGFGSATYSGTEGDNITIDVRLSSAQPRPVRFSVRPRYHGSVAWWDSDYSLGACPRAEGDPPEGVGCDFGVGVLYGEIPAGETTFSYDIETKDDGRLEGAEPFTLYIHLTSRAAELGDNPEAVITIDDNDAAEVIVSETAVSPAEETSAFYTVKLGSEPRDWVRIHAVVSNACKVKVSPAAIDLGPNGGWDDPHTFSVYGKHDYDAADEEVVITHRIEASPGSGYANAEAGPVAVTVTDKHTPGVIVTKSSVQPYLGANAKYRVHLNSDPSKIYGQSAIDCYDNTGLHTVTVTATSSNPAVATVSPASVTFTGDAYDPQVFTVHGESVGTTSITHAVTGTDPDYTGQPLVTETVTVTVVALPGQQQAQAPDEQQAQAPDEQPAQAPDEQPAQAPDEQPAHAPSAEPAPMPGPVEGLELVATADSLTASWRAPDTGDAPTKYIVRISPLGTSKGTTKTPKAKKTSVTFRNLEAGVTYKVWVRAQNKAGKGPRTYAIVTLPNAPPGPDQPQQGPSG